MKFLVVAYIITHNCYASVFIDKLVDLFANGWRFEESSVHQWIVTDLSVANLGLKNRYRIEKEKKY